MGVFSRGPSIFGLQGGGTAVRRPRPGRAFGDGGMIFGQPPGGVAAFDDADEPVETVIVDGSPEGGGGGTVGDGGFDDGPEDRSDEILDIEGAEIVIIQAPPKSDDGDDGAADGEGRFAWTTRDPGWIEDPVDGIYEDWCSGYTYTTQSWERCTARVPRPPFRVPGKVFYTRVVQMRAYARVVDGELKCFRERNYGPLGISPCIPDGLV